VGAVGSIESTARFLFKFSTKREVAINPNHAQERSGSRKPLNPHDFGQFPGHVTVHGNREVFAFP
jgi:hypothetical protein